MGKPRIVFFDVETAPAKVATFSLKTEYIGHTNILQDWYMICAAWKEVGSKETHAVWCTKPTDDYKVVLKLRNVLADADIIAGHNIKNFDIKKLQARLMFHRLEPLPEIPVIDTLREIKRVSTHTSHRLDYLSSYLCGGGKMQTSHGLWLRALEGDKKAVAEMVEYNKQDVIENEKVFNVIKPFIKFPAHMGVMIGKERQFSCPKCGSDRFHKGRDKVRITAGGFERLQRQCEKCHGYSTFHVPK